MSRPTSALRDERGFTLIELLVVMLSGIVIVIATFSLINITLRQTTTTTDRTQAEQRGRVFMTSLTQELQSGCVASDVSPIQPTDLTGKITDDASDLVFVSGESSGANVIVTTPTTVGTTQVLPTLTEHVVQYSSSAQTLTDTWYYAVSGSAATTGGPATWTFQSTPAGRRILTNVTSASFTYYSYSFPSNPTSESLVNAKSVPVPLGTSWPASATTSSVPAPLIAQVNIAYTVGPTDGSTNPLREDNLTDSVVFRLTPPTAGADNLPCD